MGRGMLGWGMRLLGLMARRSTDWNIVKVANRMLKVRLKGNFDLKSKESKARADGCTATHFLPFYL